MHANSYLPLPGPPLPPAPLQTCTSKRSGISLMRPTGDQAASGEVSQACLVSRWPRSCSSGYRSGAAHSGPGRDRTWLVVDYCLPFANWVNTILINTQISWHHPVQDIFLIRPSVLDTLTTAVLILFMTQRNLLNEINVVALLPPLSMPMTNLSQ